MAEGCMTELAIEPSRYQDIRVLMKPSDPEGKSIGEPTARFSIDGSVRYGPHNLDVAVQLFDLKHTGMCGAMFTSAI
jgi:hypothetical protein